MKKKPTSNRRKNYADYKFSWNVLLNLKLARLDFPEAQLGKPTRVVGDNGLPALRRTYKPMSEGAQLAREMAIVRQINPKAASDDYTAKVKQRLGHAWWVERDKAFLHDFDKASKVKVTTARQRETAAAYRWMLRNVVAVEACSGPTQILRLVEKHCPAWRPNEAGFFALLREIGLPVRK